MLRSSAIILAILLVLAGGYCFLACAMQRQMLFPAPSFTGGDAFERAAGAERVWLDTDGARTEAWYLPPLQAAPGPAPLVVFAHGNGELIDDWAEAFEPPRRWGAAVLLVEYPGYGRSTGSPSQASIAATLASAFDRMTARAEIDPSRIIAYGRSLGGGAVCALARERRVAALVLESTFTSGRRLARGFGLPGFLVRDPFDNLETLRAYPGPVLIVHGEHDEIIPARHAAELHAAARRSRLELAPCGHNDCLRPWPLVREFLLENGLIGRRNG
jgi:pimeloyl-ACP methyl ester carboxylesterase